MEVRAHIKYVRISPIKLRMLLDSIKELSPKVALDHLGLSQQRTAKMLYKAINSAVSNGKSQPGFDPEKAKFKVLSVDEGPVLKRFRAGPRGIARPYVRKSSHITVVLEQNDVQAKPAKAEKKPSSKKTTTKKEVNKTDTKDNKKVTSKAKKK